MHNLNLVDNLSSKRGGEIHEFKGRLLRLFIFLFVAFIVVITPFLFYQKIYAGRIYSGVYLNKNDLSFLNKREARLLLDSSIEEIERKGIVFEGESPRGKKVISIPSVLIGIYDPDLSRTVFSINLEKTVNRAFSLGRDRFFLKNFYQILKCKLKGCQIKTSFSIDKKELKEILKSEFSSLEQSPKNANFYLDRRGEIKFIKERPGYFFDFNEALGNIEKNLSLLDNQKIKLKLIYQEPQIKISEVENLSKKIVDLLNLAPVTLRYKQKKWQVSRYLFSQWITPVKENNIVKLGFDRDKINTYLKIISQQINVEPIDAKFKMKNGRVIEFQESRPGYKLDLENSLVNIISTLNKKQKDVELVVKRVEPLVLTGDVNDYGIKELIGRGISDFSGSPKNRRHNIAVGCKKLNGILIKPGEEFSLVKALGEVSQKTGYLPELVIKRDRTIPEYGGGLCQIGTTTFRAALYSGLPITARTPHSYRVIYYEPAGMDATIYRPQPDLRFINDTGHYILFQTKIKGNKLIFDFYGTSDGRKVEITKPKIYNIVKPGPPIYIKTTDLPPGKKKRIEMSHNGADTEFVRKITYPDGRVKKEIWKSHYKPWREVWLVGVKESELNKNNNND